MKKYILTTLTLAVAMLCVPMLAEKPGEQNQDPPQSGTSTTEHRPINEMQPPQASDSATKKPTHTGSAATGKTYYALSEPNDPYYSSGWALQALSPQTAWDTTKTNDSVTIAVLDSGFALNHQDLTNTWLINQSEYGDGKQTDGVDNDGNGYVDDWRGWDFENGDNLPSAGSTNPSGSGVAHGTEVAGLAGAQTNNGIGIASAAWGAKLLPLQVMSDDGTGTTASIAPAIYYAVDNGADVINMSLGTDGDDPDVRDAINYAVSNKVVVVAAAGNCGTQTGMCQNLPVGYIKFPASYDRVISVGALTQSQQRASFSSYGARLDISAPGSGSIASTTWQSGNQLSAYKTSLNGTSYASPIAASSIALLRSVRPNTTIDDVRAIIAGSANKPAAMSGNFYQEQYGHGLISLASAVGIASEINAGTSQTPELMQAGSASSEHSFGSADLYGSGCVTVSGDWCTIWVRNQEKKLDRYLPYKKVPQSGNAGWSWSTNVLGPGDWSIRAIVGELTSPTPYPLARK